MTATLADVQTTAAPPRERCPHMVEVRDIRYYCERGAHDDDVHSTGAMAAIGWAMRADYPGRGVDALAEIVVEWRA